MDDGVLRSNTYVLKGKDMTKFIDNREIEEAREAE